MLYSYIFSEVAVILRENRALCKSYTRPASAGLRRTQNQCSAELINGGARVLALNIAGDERGERCNGCQGHTAPFRAPKAAEAMDPDHPWLGLSGCCRNSDLPLVQK